MTKSVILTPAHIDRLKGGALPDREVPGLSIVVSAPDRKRWRFKRVIAGTRTIVELILGTFPEHSIEEAREWAAPLSKAVARGEDPRKIQRMERALAMSVAAAHAIYMDAMRRGDRKKLKPRTIADKDDGIMVRVNGDRLSFDSLYPALGSDVCSELAAPLGAVMSEAGCLKVDTHQRTNVPGLYAAGVVAYNMDYALAPENPYPAALDDATNAWQFVVGEGFSPDDILVGGESAGGNLTLALVLKLRQRGLALPTGLYLLSPWLDLTQSGESYGICAARDPMVSRDVLQGMADSYCGNAAPANPLISPLFAELAGLPPLFVQAGSDEVLLGDSTRLAHRFALAGGDVTLRVWPEMVHAWPLFQHAIPVAGNAAIAEAGQWIANRLSVGQDR